MDYDDWDGQHLGGDCAALAISTPTEEAAAAAESPRVVVASGLDRTCVIRPGQFGEFLAVHHDVVLVCHDVGPLFWAILDELQRTNDWPAWRAFWDVPRRNRLRDVKQLDQLLGLAQDGGDPSSRDLGELISLNRDDSPARDEEDQNHIDATQGKRRASVDAMVERVARDAGHIVRIYMTQRRLIGKIVLQLGIHREVNQRFGPLASGLHVQGAIALERAARRGLHLGEAEVGRLRRRCDEVHRESSRQLRASRASLACFIWNGDQVKLDHSGLPSFDKRKLRAWLEERVAAIPGEYDFPWELPRTADGRVSTQPDLWNDLALLDPKFRAWSRLWAAASARKALGQIETAGDLRLRPRYEVVPRIRSMGPNLERLRELDPSLGFEAPPGHVLLVGRLPDLVLRCHAEVGERRGRPTMLAGLYRDEINPVRYIACEFYNQKLARDEDVRMEWEEFQAQDDEDPGRFHAWKALSRALLDLGPRGLTRSSIRAILKEDPEITFTPNDINGYHLYLIRTLIKDFGGFLDDEVFEILARKLGCSQSELEARLFNPDHPGQSDTVVRNAIAGKSNAPGILTELHALCRVDIWRERLAGGQGSPELYQDLFSEVVISPTGRVRKGLFLTRRRAGEHLDLADDALKSVLFAVIAAGHELVACRGDEFVVEARENAQAEALCRKIETVCDEAVRSIMKHYPPRCEVHAQAGWRHP